MLKHPFSRGFVDQLLLKAFVKTLMKCNLIRHLRSKAKMYLNQLGGKNKMKPTNPNADTYVDKQRQYLFVTSPANSLVRHADFTHWGDTLVGHPCLTLSLNALVRHSCLTVLWDTLVRHFLLGTLVRHSYLTLLWDTLPWHSYLTPL